MASIHAWLEFISHMHLGNCSIENILFVLSTNPGSQALASADVHKIEIFCVETGVQCNQH